MLKYVIHTVTLH